MELIKPDVNIDFVGKRRYVAVISVVLILVGLTALIVRGGPNYGVDFTGGTVVQVRFDQSTDAAQIKELLVPEILSSALVQRFGDGNNEFLIRAEETDDGLQGMRIALMQKLEQGYGEGSVELRRVEMVGPQVGKDLRKKGLMAIMYAMVGILLYISWRFELRFAVGAVVALLHDVVLTFGAFSIFDKEIGLPVIAAFLAIIGYSLNDTIVVYDRIRENRGRYNDKSFPELINRSINETLSRTILTSITTLLVVLALFVFGGGVIHDFAFALLIGVVVGTYSSIFIASSMLLLWDKFQTKEPRKA
ncbi:MAG: protein translocase subunit SecF [Desulfuromonadaceae bacterium]|nr:protein translocase subunit SecF [Desulfuromonadaceae bacterium]